MDLYPVITRLWLSYREEFDTSIAVDYSGQQTVSLLSCLAWLDCHGPSFVIS